MDLKEIKQLLAQARHGLGIVQRLIAEDGETRPGILLALQGANEGIQQMQQQPCPDPTDLAAWRNWMGGMNVIAVAVEMAMHHAVAHAKSGELALDACLNQLNAADGEGRIRRVQDALTHTSEALLMLNSIASDARALPIEAQVAANHIKQAISSLDEVLGLIGDV